MELSWTRVKAKGAPNISHVPLEHGTGDGYRDWMTGGFESVDGVGICTGTRYGKGAGDWVVDEDLLWDTFDLATTNESLIYMKSLVLRRYFWWKWLFVVSIVEK